MTTPCPRPFVTVVPAKAKLTRSAGAKIHRRDYYRKEVQAP